MRSSGWACIRCSAVFAAVVSTRPHGDKALRQMTNHKGESAMKTAVGLLWRVLLLSCLMAATGFVSGQPAGPDPAAEIKAAFMEAEKAALRGPQTVQLGNQATLALPQGF